jgi:hypothetical protein
MTTSLGDLILLLALSILGIRIPSDIVLKPVMGSPSIYQYTDLEHEEEGGHTGSSSHVLAS